MTVREELEMLEMGTLCEDACLSKNSRRKKPEAKCPMRTEFQRDRDRILHSNAFRRLKHKTQVFLDPVGDHYRTRLTHSLEVSQIARTIARALKLNEDLTEAIALGHDLGHAPFGHTGERVLNDICSGGFRHCLQSVRVVDYIEKGGEGLNLTFEVKNGIACHTDKVAVTKEGYIVRLADKIAYINHDIDDSIRAGVLTEEMLPRDITEVLGHSKSERITTLICSIVKNGASDIRMEPEIQAAHDALRKYLFANVYNNSIAKAEDSKAEMLVEKLFRYYYKFPEKMSEEYVKIMERYSKERAVCDYISGMSDDYAINIFKEIFVPKGWHS
ncbi:MAG: deoxyguanosinetriphosphate triphosphohydrolase [Oscillospiraceae bacterium]|nr:deoxyguanosinetriphosphate triphosphohydrolase [Oscillospiraceae bacterium]